MPKVLRTLAHIPQSLVDEVEAHRRYLLYLACRKGYDQADAEDLVSEAIYRFYRTKNHLDPRSSLATKLALSLWHRICNDILRRKLVFVSLESIKENTLSYTPLCDQRLELYVTLKRLKKPVADKIIRYYLQEETLEHIAKTCHVTRQAVWGQISRGVARLQALAKEKNNAEDTVED